MLIPLLAASPGEVCAWRTGKGGGKDEGKNVSMHTRVSTALPPVRSRWRMDIEIHTRSDVCCLCPLHNSKDAWVAFPAHACSALTAFPSIHAHAGALALDAASDNHSNRSVLTSSGETRQGLKEFTPVDKPVLSDTQDCAGSNQIWLKPRSNKSPTKPHTRTPRSKHHAFSPPIPTKQYLLSASYPCVYILKYVTTQPGDPRF